MNQKTVDLYVKGERKPSVEFIKNICTTFGVSADWLLGLPDHGGAVTANGPHAIAAGAHATVSTGGDCSKCKLMQAHVREITGR